MLSLASGSESMSKDWGSIVCTPDFMRVVTDKGYTDEFLRPVVWAISIKCTFKIHAYRVFLHV